tara:strand:+ start:517 stop:648 length:132 start_codon:yes stop_codon:yes gene_type:complete
MPRQWMTELMLLQGMLVETELQIAKRKKAAWKKRAAPKIHVLT